MENSWHELHILISSEAVDLISQALSDIGCLGVIVEDISPKAPVAPVPDPTPPGTSTLRCFFPGDRAPDLLLEEVEVSLRDVARLIPGPDPKILAVLPVAREDWADGWRQQFHPQRFGPRLVIKPSWEAWSPGSDDVIIELDPGMAFGTGTHPTTRLCLQALAEAYEAERPPERVLDVGTGSGILAMAAAALGAKRVLACDIDPEACRVAEENSRRNNLSGCIEFSVDPLDRLPGTFDAVLANILAEENIRLAPSLVTHLASGGLLVLSGILREKEPAVTEAFAAYDWSSRESLYEDEWVCLCYRRA